MDRSKSEREERGDRWHEFRNRWSEDLHRGIVAELPGHLHALVHDPAVPRGQRAQALSDHFRDGGLGMHFTPHINIANRAAGNAANDLGLSEDGEPAHTDVMFHIRPPAQRSVIRDPATLTEHGIGWQFSKDEDEVPVRPGSPLHLTGVSWKVHEPQYPLEPYEHADFGRPQRHVASLGAAREATDPAHEDLDAEAG